MNVYIIERTRRGEAMDMASLTCRREDYVAHRSRDTIYVQRQIEHGFVQLQVYCASSDNIQRAGVKEREVVKEDTDTLLLRIGNEFRETHCFWSVVECCVSKYCQKASRNLMVFK